jgi:beta-N-acetylhexosaminidase
MHGHPHPPTLTELRESAHYVNALHHIAGLGLNTADLNLQIDPTDYCARS